MLVKKDLQAIWSRKGLRALLMAIPLILVVVLPIFCFAAISLLPVESVRALPETLVSLLSAGDGEIEYRTFWINTFTILVCPVLFLTVPILCAVVSASCAFVGEKENGTLETLLLSSMEARTVFHAKITACVLISVLISFLSFLAFSVTVTVVDLLASAAYFLSFEWLVTLFLLMPAVSLFSVVFVSLTMGRVSTSTEALQTMGYLLLPLTLFYLAQLSGAYRITVPLLLLISLALLVAAVILFNRSARKFDPEQLLTRDAEESI